MRKKRDYHKKRFSNPYFPKDKPRHRVRKWILCIAVVVIALIFILRWDRLTISAITVSGNEFTESFRIENAVREQLDSRRWLLFPQRNALFFSEGATKRHLQKQFQFESVRISVKDFSNVTVNVTERKPVAAVITNGVRYHIDDKGVVIREFSDVPIITETTENGTDVIRSGRDSLSVPEIINRGNDDATIGEQLIPELTVAFIVNVSTELKGRADFEVVRYILGGAKDTEVTMVTSEGWEARLNSLEKPIAQTEAVLTVLRDKVADRNKLEYIDVRYGDKIFYQ
jgi:cell division septal protein FtsQ